MIKLNKITSVFLVTVMMFAMVHLSMVNAVNVNSEVGTAHLQDSLVNNENASRSLFSLNNTGDDFIEKDENSEKRSFSILRLNVFVYLFYKIFNTRP